VKIAIFPEGISKTSFLNHRPLPQRLRSSSSPWRPTSCSVLFRERISSGRLQAPEGYLKLDIKLNHFHHLYFCGYSALKRTMAVTVQNLHSVQKAGMNRVKVAGQGMGLRVATETKGGWRDMSRQDPPSPPPNPPPSPSWRIALDGERDRKA
jgi:hypothetical protein